MPTMYFMFVCTYIYGYSVKGAKFATTKCVLWYED